MFEEKGRARIQTHLSIRTLQQQLQQQNSLLHEQNERFQRLSEVSFEGIVIYDEGRILDVNTRIEAMFDYQRKDMLEKDFLEFVNPESHDTFRERLQVDNKALYKAEGIKHDGSRCGAGLENLFEHEFFGHRRGAFTGADRDRPGYFDRAHGGTLFLDEVGELSPTLQVKLLRVLEEKEYIPVGDTVSKKVDVRIVAATNRNLKEQVKQGGMRKDFFYRIRVIVINLPPLRDRLEDIPLLIDHFLRHYGDPRDHTSLPGQITTALCSYHWPGNIREFQNEIQRYLAQQSLEFIGDAPPSPLDPEGLSLEGLNFSEAVDAFEKHLLRSTLVKAGGNTAQAAEILGTSVRTIQRKIQKHDLKGSG